MRIRLAVPHDLTDTETKHALEAALESVTRADEALVRRRVVPLANAGIRGGVRWKPEPPGDEHFDLASTVMRRGWGDCDDLAPWHAASLRATGQDPDARAVVRRSGPGRWHALVRRSDGSHEDPSRAAGMGSRVSGPYDDAAAAALWPLMFGDRMSIATHPWRGGFASRVDLPTTWDIPSALSTVATARSPVVSGCAAIQGAIGMGRYGGMIPEDELRLRALHDLLRGESMQTVAEAAEHEFGEDAVGFLPMLAPLAMNLAAPMLSKLMPGGGGGAPAPAPATPGAVSVAPPYQGGGGGGSRTVAMPGGPIIVRF